MTTHLDSGPRDARPLCGASLWAGMFADDVTKVIKRVDCSECIAQHDEITSRQAGE